MELYAFLFLSKAWKAVWICSLWEVHTKSPSCDQMNMGNLWASWCLLATWTQELVSVSYLFRKAHIGLRVDDVKAWKHSHDQSAGP